MPLRQYWPFWITGAVFLFLAGAALLPLLNIGRPIAPRSYCQSSLKQIALACQQYTEDYDRRFPGVSSGGKEGWTELLQPYLKSWQIFQCPSGQKPSGQKPSAQERSDYFFNAGLGHVKTSRTSSTTIAFGDGIDNAGANAHLMELPFDWKTDETSPAWRHLKGANYAFADGHVKLLTPERIVAAKLSGSTPLDYTFHVPPKVKGKDPVRSRK